MYGFWRGTQFRPFKVLLDHNPEYKIIIHESILIKLKKKLNK